MKIKVSEATNSQLDWLVAKIENTLPASFDDWTQTWPRYSTNWAQGGPIIERQEIELRCWSIDGWAAQDTNYRFLNTPYETEDFTEGYGPTPLVAGLRCYVTSKLGDEVEVPEELT